MPFRRTIVLLCVLLALLLVGYLWLQHVASQQRGGGASGVTVDKQAETFAQRSFDPAAPPSDMPPMEPGEEAFCDTNFVSNVNVGGNATKIDETHEIVTITQVTVTLGLVITNWVPNGAMQHVIDHEQGHRQISEFYYQSADKLAARIAAAYIGRKDYVSGADLQAETSKSLQQSGAEITDEYDKELNPGPAQERYDAITDHARNDVGAQDAVAMVLRDAAAASNSPGANAGN
jgi:hypothetical protein